MALAASTCLSSATERFRVSESEILFVEVVRNQLTSLIESYNLASGLRVRNP
jgi:hypothetical protein